MHRRIAVGLPAFVAAIVVTAVVVAAAIFAVAPFATTVTKTMPVISTSLRTTTSTQISTKTTTVIVTPTTSSSSTTSSISSSSCSGYPPGGNCPGTFSYTFTLSVNYTGPWKLTYEGCSGLGTCSPAPVMGSLNGTGYYSKPVTLTGPNNSGLTLCGQAQKLDASNATLILTITGYNETSQPYGSVSYCGGVVP